MLSQEEKYDWIKIQLQQAGIKRMSIKNSKGISFARGENV